MEAATCLCDSCIVLSSGGAGLDRSSFVAKFNTNRFSLGYALDIGEKRLVTGFLLD